MTIGSARAGVTGAAACLAIAGAALLFGPHEVAGMIGSPGTDLLLQLYAGALLALAAMNYIARGSSLGGIYGRAVVTADQVHFTIGALVLIQHALRSPASPALWIVVAAYAAGAVFFNLLLFSGTDAASTSSGPSSRGRWRR
jgi:hypothetical protein